MSIRVHAGGPARSPGPIRGYGGLLSLVGFAGTLFVLIWGGGWMVGFILEAPLSRILLVLGCFAVAAGLVAFEFAHELEWSHPLRRVWAYWDTLRRTAIESLFVPAAWICALAVPALIVFAGLFAPDALLAALSEVTLAPFASGEGAKALGAGVTVAAGFIAVRNLSQYLVAGRGYLIRTLRKYAPTDPTLLAQTPLDTLKSYHVLLRFSGAVAFLFELVLQVVAFGVVTWGISTALPGLGLFADANAATLPNTIFYWTDRVFALVDGQGIFGFSFSPLEPNKAVWPFGFTVLFFKLFAVAMIIRLFQDSLHLRPRDISPSWGDALERASTEK